MSHQHYQSRRNELVSVIPPLKVRTAVLRVNIGELNVGDLLQFSSMFQGSNPTGSNGSQVHTACEIVLDSAQSGNNGIEDISGYGAMNITTDMHHYTFTHSGMHTVSEYVADAWVKVITWSEPGYELDTGRGQLDVLVTKP